MKPTFHAGKGGFTLIHLAVLMVAFGAFLAASLPFFNMGIRLRALETSEDVMVQARDAIEAFAIANNRLPCPDGGAVGDSVDGEEDSVASNCTGAFGWLPFRTLGLSSGADSYGGLIRYGVNPSLASPSIASVAAFRQLLITAGTAAFDATLVHTTAEGEACTAGTNVPFAIVSYGPDGGVANDNNAAPPCFESPDRARSSTYDDTVMDSSFFRLDSLGTDITTDDTVLPAFTAARRELGADMEVFYPFTTDTADWSGNTRDLTTPAVAGPSQPTPVADRHSTAASPNTSARRLVQSASATQYLQVNNDSGSVNAMGFNLSGTDFTIMAWVNQTANVLTTDQDYSCVLCNMDSTGGYIFGITSGATTATGGSVYFRGGPAATARSSTGTVPLGSWNHLAVTFDTSDGEIHFYINGVRSDPATVSSTVTNPDTTTPGWTGVGGNSMVAVGAPVVTSFGGGYVAGSIIADSVPTTVPWTITVVDALGTFSVTSSVGTLTAGSVGTDYVSPYFIVPSTAWTGTWAIGDTLVFNGPSRPTRFDGDLDDVRIYKRRFSDQEILSQYNREKP
ncbi:MAG: LamG domain-containing protein [Magnetococcales bacterium]|nr:LamG domain-containing protein [Magnetococcales bacterium]